MTLQRGQCAKGQLHVALTVIVEIEHQIDPIATEAPVPGGFERDALRVVQLIRAADDAQNPRNLLTLSFHRDGLFGHMREPECWVPAYWQRVARDAACREWVREIAGWPHMQAVLANEVQADATAVLLEHYQLDGRAIDLLSMMTTPGVPTDIHAASLRVNLLFPADAATDDWLRALDS